jgi:hypothetical protein
MLLLIINAMLPNLVGGANASGRENITRTNKNARICHQLRSLKKHNVCYKMKAKIECAHTCYWFQLGNAGVFRRIRYDFADVSIDQFT